MHGSHIEDSCVSIHHVLALYFQEKLNHSLTRNVAFQILEVPTSAELHTPLLVMMG